MHIKYRVSTKQFKLSVLHLQDKRWSRLAMYHLLKNLRPGIYGFHWDMAVEVLQEEKDIHNQILKQVGRKDHCIQILHLLFSYILSLSQNLHEIHYRHQFLLMLNDQCRQIQIDYQWLKRDKIKLFLCFIWIQRPDNICIINLYFHLSVLKGPLKLTFKWR